MYSTTVYGTDNSSSIIDYMLSKDVPSVKFLIDQPFIEVKTAEWGVFLNASTVGHIIFEKVDEEAAE